jgi:hypothetical protein
MTSCCVISCLCCLHQQLALVSACYSQSAGAAFVEAGVPHVVAIRTADQVTDAAAMRFADSFYDAIFVGGYTGTVSH